MLFILYLWVGVGYNLITIFSIWSHHVYKENSNMMNFIVLFDFVLLCIMCGVNAWNWFLAMSGWSSVEMWSNKTKVIYFSTKKCREESRSMTTISEASEITYTEYSELIILLLFYHLL